MPCRCDDFGYASTDNAGMQKELDNVTNLLCWLCQELEKGNQSFETGLLILNSNPKLAAWWKKHQKSDKIRIEKENKLKEIEQAKKKALAKLTPKEKQLLRAMFQV